MKGDRHLAALLAAIKASPGDDLVRLAFADRLDELGDLSGHARFIRAQITTERHFESPGYNQDDPDPCASEEYEARQAFKGYAEFWGDKLEVSLWWRRGFVFRASALASTWWGHGKALCREHPIEDAFVDGTRPSTLLSTVHRWFRIRPGDWKEHGWLAAPTPAWLPPAWFDKLRRTRGASADVKRYRTRLDAIKALGVAVLAWAQGGKA